ncbi:kinesin-like protein KIF24 [Solea solea]|uniref:kinesin-like protein KIF24 n=1 Tax=Solea solea TaxID=90069 RepID=UPI00272B3E16|nr:kinesin-like protein KIF24 [Solea solea]
MKIYLKECLSAFGLQHHYARFMSMGIRCVAHLSALIMEDFPILGIRTMEERTRLFNLIQMVKTLDSLEYEDEDGDDYIENAGAKGFAVVNGCFTNDGCVGHDEDIDDAENERDFVVNRQNAATFDRPSCLRRRPDLSHRSTDHHQRLPSRPIRSAPVYTGHNVNAMSVHGKGSATPGRDNHITEYQSHPSNHLTGGDTKDNSCARSLVIRSPKCASVYQQKPRPATVVSKRSNGKPSGLKDPKSKKDKVLTEISSNGDSGFVTNSPPIYESKRTPGYNYGLPRSSTPALNKKRQGEQRICVCVRKRPLTCAESRRGEADAVTTSDGECVVINETKVALDLTQYILQHRFFFNQVFGEESSNEEVYQRTAYPLVQHMLSGGEATCFAYGQTGAGKTHTMLGSATGKPGLYELAVRDIFTHLSTSHVQNQVYVSFFEIYCGHLYDLLDHRKRLFAREDRKKAVQIAGLRTVRVESADSLLEVISQGIKERKQGTNGVNALSSRSHALLEIQLKGENLQSSGRIWFVDLAGSERASDTKDPNRQSRIEGAEINQSLLALKECIRTLDQKKQHIPFRQSKLTQVLKDSFIGDSLTCMIANISPCRLATEHTLNTLRYADRVKELTKQECLRGGNVVKIPVITRKEIPPKKQKLVTQREDFSPTTPHTRSSTEDTNLCFTPKNSRWGEETSAVGRRETGLERITPVNVWVGDKNHRREKAGERKGRRRDNGRDRGINSHSGNDQNTRAGPEVGQIRNEQPLLYDVRRYLPHRQTERQRADRVSGTMTANVAAQMSNGYQFEDMAAEGEKELSSTEDMADGVWSNEGEGGPPHFQSTHKQVPAKRPLSQAWEMSPNNHSPESKHTRCTSSSLGKHFSSSPSTTQPPSPCITRIRAKRPAKPPRKPSENPAYSQTHGHLEVKTNLSVLPQNETYADYLDPLSMSLLQVDQQVATASFLQGKHNNLPLGLLENGRAENGREVKKELVGKVLEDEVEDIPRSLLQLLKAKTHCPHTSDPVSAVKRSDGGKDMCCSTHEHCQRGWPEPPVPDVKLSPSKDMDCAQCRVVQAHWEQFEEMKDLCHTEGTLLCQQPNMTFGEYVQKLEEIMERKARCFHNMRAQLKPYLKRSHSDQAHNY